MDEVTQEQWDKAKEHFFGTMKIYQDMLGQPGVLTAPALMIVFDPIARRFNEGERTPELYEEMMGVE